MFKPKELPALDSLKIGVLDIETSGLDPFSSKLLAFAVSDNIVDCRKKPEYLCVLELINLLKDFDIIVGHNVMDFDLWYIKGKIDQYGLWNEDLEIFVIDKIPVSATSQNGQPLNVRYAYVRVNGRKIAIFDTLIAVAKKDYVLQKLSSYSLKVAPVEFGLKKKRRVTLTAEEIHKSQSDELLVYLAEDIEDTRLLFDYLAPEYYYQLRVLPDSYNLQDALLRGNARKWNDVLKEYYGFEPTPDPKKNFKGGYTEVHEGLFLGNVAKLDISSLYPNIMLEYDYFSRKDTDRYMREVIEYLTWERLNIFKPKAKQGDKLAGQMASAMKPFINSGYGFLTTSGVGFNDFHTGAKIPAKGRGIVKVMKKDLEKAGCRIIEIDTDGIIFQFKHHDQIQEAKELFKKHLPERISADLEFIYPKGAVYSYKAKNYVVFDNRGIPVIRKGLFRKRNRTWYEKNLVLIALRRIVKTRSIKSADDVFTSFLKQITQRKVKPQRIKRCRTIAKSEKKALKDLGVLPSSKACFFYTIEKIGKRGKIYYKLTKNYEEYAPEYYVKEVQKVYKTFFQDLQIYDSNNLS